MAAAGGAVYGREMGLICRHVVYFRLLQTKGGEEILKRLSYVVALAAVFSLMTGCFTTRHTTRHTTRTVHVKTNPAGKHVKTHKPHGGKEKVMVKTNPSGTSVKIKVKDKH